MHSNKSRLELIDIICRICAREEPNSIAIFGEEGKKQDIVKKIEVCLPVNIRENDSLPKKICLTCLTKLDDFYSMHRLCKEAQIKIEKKLYSLRHLHNVEQCRISLPIEEKLKDLTESYPVSYGDSVVICLAPESTPPPPPAPPTVTREAQVIPQAMAAGSAEPVMAPVTYLTPAPPPAAVPVAPSPVTDDVYPQTLIQVPQNPASEQPTVYQNRSVPLQVSKPEPMPAPIPVPRRRPMTSPATMKQPAPTPLRRQNGETTNRPPAKKLCGYCNKSFTDDIIDHHVSLHLRQTFRTCLDCNKNFRSEEALERHRCGTSETIDLDADDEEPIVL